ncbi:MAG: sigma-54-dependent transcriptional regulator, partial [Gemmataceae bacterium]
MAGTTHPIQLLLVDDDDDLRHDLAQLFRKQGHDVTAAVSGEDALNKAAHSRFDVALLDLHLPGISGIDVLVQLKERQPELEALMLTAHSSIETAVEAMRRGAYDYLTKPFRVADLEVHVQKAFEKVQLQRREQQWLQQLSYESPRYRLIGSSPAMRKVVALIEKVAATDATVLVRGASGTGKELVARALHTNSSRRTRPLVTINCAALQENLLESELFGHDKGAFTGAVAAKPGLVEVAEGGTLFIDEIGEMAPGLQAKLLRVLEDGHYRRVGGTREMNADVRIVAATNRDLTEEIKNSRFREDLYYRLNVVSIHLPALR